MASEALTRHYLNIAALSLLVYDNFLSWDKEKRYIWDTAPWAVRLSFCIGRYIALAGQITNVICSSPSYSGWKPEACLRWHRSQMAVVLILFWNMELVMVVRVYALYNRSIRVGGLLAFWFLLSRGFDAWRVTQMMQEVVMDKECLVPRPSVRVEGFIVLVLLNQGIFWSLTYRRYRSAVREGWSGNPIIRVVMRDNSSVFVVLAGLFCSILPYEIYIKQVLHVMIPIMICTFSIMSSRLILNLRGLKVSEKDAEQGEISTITSTVD